MNFKKIIPIIFGIAIIAGLIVKIGLGELINSINNVDKYYLGLCAVVLFITMLIKSLRWQYILEPLGMSRRKIAFVSYFIGQATNEILPTGSGELARLGILKKYTNKSLIWFGPSVILERLYDMLLLLILSIFFAYTIETSFALLILLPIIGFVGAVFIKPELIDVPIKVCRFLDGINALSKFARILRVKLIETQFGLKIYQENKKILLITFILTAISWIFFETLSHYILLLGFDIRIPYINLLGIVAISWILGTVSMLPGGLGAREAVYALMLTKFGVVFSTGMAVAVVYRGIVYLLFGSLAIISVARLDKK
jgi:uncharacterized protein (TIRG00374 family)